MKLLSLIFCFAILVCSQINASQINFNGTFVSVTEVCYQEDLDSFRTLNKVTIYEWVGDEHKAVGKDFLITTRTYLKYFSDEAEGEIRQLRYPLGYNLNENDDLDISATNRKKIFFKIPNC